MTHRHFVFIAIVAIILIVYYFNSKKQSSPVSLVFISNYDFHPTTYLIEGNYNTVGDNNMIETNIKENIEC
jgi:hypothetical protein